MDLSQLRAARNGLPTEHQATSKIATFAVIPAAMVGFLAGTQLVGLADPIGRLAWVCTASASVASFGAVCLVLGVYRLFGFRCLVVLADALEGGFLGLVFGAAFALSLAWLKLVPHPHWLWPLLLIPLGAGAFPLIRFRMGRKQVPDAEAEAAE